MFEILPMTKLILDTNVLIYGLDGRSEFHAASVQLLTNSQYELFVPTKVISEYFAVCSKLKVPPATTFNFYLEIRKNTEVLYPDSSSLSEFEKLIQKYQPNGNRVFDLEIASMAIANNIPHLATANQGDFQGVSEVSIVPLTRKKHE